MDVGAHAFELGLNFVTDYLILYLYSWQKQLQNNIGNDENNHFERMK